MYFNKIVGETILKKLIIPFVFSALVMSGCASSSGEQSEEAPTNKQSQPVQPQLEYLLGSNDWSVVTDLTDNAKTLEAYQFAVEHPEVLDYMPCYCGCYEEDGHTSNTDCFVDSVNDKVAILDTMGFG